MEKNCSATVSGEREVSFADTGLEAGDVHTAHTKHPSEVALNAFLDFLSLVDAKYVVRTYSSFSGTATGMKGLSCRRLTKPMKFAVSVCLEESCDG